MSGKLLFGFALLVCAALVGMTNTTYADDTPQKQDDATTTSQGTQPKLLKELPLWDGWRPITIQYESRRVLISTIVDGLEGEEAVLGDPEECVSFKLRTDGWKHTSVQFFGAEDALFRLYGRIIPSSAIVLVPDEESLKLWQNWYIKEYAKQKEEVEQPERHYPARVLPPK